MALTPNTMGSNDTLVQLLGQEVPGRYLLALTTLCASKHSAMTPGATTTALFTIPVPFACTVQRISVGNVTSAGGASRPTFNIAATTLAQNLIASAASIVNASVVNIDHTTTPALAYNQLAKDEILTFNLTTVASEAVTGICVVITVCITGFPLAATTYR